MTHGVLSALCALAGIILALPVALFTMGRIRASKRFRTGATFAAALLSSFAFYDARDRGCIEESEGETKRKKDDQSGDPPIPGDTTPRADDGEV
jgi:hypothetical protein